MNLRRATAVARKEFLHIFRDPRSLAMAIAIPMLLLVLFGYALTLDVDNVPMVVWDQSESLASREFIAGFGGSRYFSVREHVRNYREVERAIDSGRALAALVVPVDFAGRIESGRPAAVQLIVDGSDSNTATIAMGYANAVARAPTRRPWRFVTFREPAAVACKRRSTCGRESGSTPIWSRRTTSFPG